MVQLSPIVKDCMLLLCNIKKTFLSLCKPFLQCFLRLQRKWLFSDYKFVEIISEEVSTSCTSMSIIQTKERAIGPSHTCWKVFVLWLFYVKHNRDPVLVIIPVRPMTRDGSISMDYPKFLCRYTRILLWIRNIDLIQFIPLFESWLLCVQC